MKNHLIVILLTLPTLILGQEPTWTFDYTFEGNYNLSSDDYSQNFTESYEDIAVYVDEVNKKMIVTTVTDTIFHHTIINKEQDDDGYTTYLTTTFIYDAVFMFHPSAGLTVLYEWQEQTEQMPQHYKHKQYFGNEGEILLTFNSSFSGEYNLNEEEYTNNVAMDSTSKFTFHVDRGHNKIMVTKANETLFAYNVVGKQGDSGQLIFQSQNDENDGIFVLAEDRKSLTFLYNWHEQTDDLPMHYINKYFFENK